VAAVHLLFIVALGLVCVCAAAIAAQDSTAGEALVGTAWTTPANAVDAQVVAALAKHGVRLRNPCSDGVFVTFERGVSVAYRDRKHIWISGTASIDRKGAIVHPGDALRQLDRTMENVEALLRNAGAALRDSCMFIVYVREPSDLAVAQAAVRERLGETSIQIVVAPVCRPGWLIEVECQAIAEASSPALPAF
jgi:enamine deaminase RidA (YjgF/YER057c/UK114 family)